MKDIFKKIKNILISGVIAFIALTLFCMVYYNVPIHSDNQDGSTDYVWEENKLYISMTEGIGYGKTNNEGLMNLYDYEDGMNIDVLIMGSSHLQGFPIPLEDNCSNVLNELLVDKTVYNIAVTGHNIKTCISNLDAALSKYQPKIVVIETSNIVLSDENINKILENKIKNISSVSNPIVNFLQKNPFLRQTYGQIESFMATQTADEDTSTNLEAKLNTELTNNLLEYIESIGDKYNTKIILMYHPTVKVTNDELIINCDSKTSKQFEELCKENNIYYLDMSNRYAEEYKNNYTLPTGFINTSVGVGHINPNGHKMMAEELSKIIKEID